MKKEKWNVEVIDTDNSKIIIKTNKDNTKSYAEIIFKKDRNKDE